MSTDYDIGRAFKRIENDLIDSMMRNMKKHQVEEKDLGITWEQWQTLQLKELERYRQTNARLFDEDFKQINNKIDATFRSICEDAQADEEARLLDQIKKGKFAPDYNRTGEYFNLNDKKLNNLIVATRADFTKGEYAMLRRANDIYRQVIFDAMTYANITNDYKKAVDMATHDFLLKGINCVQYKNGARHTMQDYASMAIRTGNKRAYLMGEGNAHDKLGLHTVRVNKRPHACPLCVGFLGKLLIDDVYGGGTIEEAIAQGIPTLSQAMDEGFLHPNCKDMYSVYIEGVSQPAKGWSRQEIEDIVGEYNQEQEIKHADDMAESYGRLAKYSLDDENKERAQGRADYWQGRADALRAETAPTVQEIADNALDTVTDTVADAVADVNDAITIERVMADAKAGTKSLQDLVKYGDVNGVDYMPVQPLANKLTEQEIIERIAGGDMTQGSCVSLAMAFTGNMGGYDVLDFRGGKSMRMMALNMNNKKLCDLKGVVATKIEDFSAVKGASKLISDMEDDKLYLLVTGKHASIVRKVDGTAEYLELQSASSSGWHKFKDTTLKRRFGCTKSRTIYGTKYLQESYAIELESLYNNKEFEDLLGFINTASDQQKKGALGSVK